MQKRIEPVSRFDKKITVPADKSISHRAVMFNCAADGRAKIENALMSDDVLSTIDCMRALGAEISVFGTTVTVEKPADFRSAKLYTGNSGTTTRLIAGLLAGRRGEYVIDGDASIRKRPMGRVITPLGSMGAKITADGGLCPLRIVGAELKGIDYEMPVASAQVKSAILLAGLSADGETTVREKIKSRDHTERMLLGLGADISVDGNDITVKKSRLRSRDMRVCGDISSAAFPLVMAAAKSGARVLISGAGLNPTRTGIISVLKRIGADLEIMNLRDESGEPVGDIALSYRENLSPMNITREDIPSLVDEIPALATLACFIRGESVISGAEELKVKESNRIKTIAENLAAMGADVTEKPDGLVIRGKGYLKGGAEINTYGDHRIAMSMAVAAALSERGAVINDAECVSVSYPDFYDLLGGV